MNEVLSKNVFIVSGYPFIRETRSAHWLADENGCPDIDCWRPGVKSDDDGDHGHTLIAQGYGEMHLRVVSYHKPGRYPERVFYERCFVDPDGKTFSAPRLHVATRRKFNKLCVGYAYDFSFEPYLEPCQDAQ